MTTTTRQLPTFHVGDRVRAGRLSRRWIGTAGGTVTKVEDDALVTILGDVTQQITVCWDSGDTRTHVPSEICHLKGRA